jgi:histidyl-tRNA synthetase
MGPLPGFRDFYPEDCARRNHLIGTWREVCRRYGFIEFDGPILESTEIYQRKSGPEIVGQLFNFTDKSHREVSLRPEMTPTLARMVAAREREFRKPLKWFSIGQFFRYEKQQRGRLREFYQLNCDIVGEPAAGAEAEIISLMIDLMRAFGMTSSDFFVRISSRMAWAGFLQTKNISAERSAQFLAIVDKLERETEDVTEKKLGEFGITLGEVRDFVHDPQSSPALSQLQRELEQRGLVDFVRIDLSVVRGLPYYTGAVFEIFSREVSLRAVAGGGRYDNLVRDFSDGAVDLPAVGFGMGDVVLGELIDETPAAADQRKKHVNREQALQIYAVIAKEERRNDALAQIARLRAEGFRVDYPLTHAKVGRQFQTAEQLGAQIAVLYGDEWPDVKVKDLTSRKEELVPNSDLPARLKDQIT